MHADDTSTSPDADIMLSRLPRWLGCRHIYARHSSLSPSARMRGRRPIADHVLLILQRELKPRAGGYDRIRAAASIRRHWAYISASLNFKTRPSRYNFAIYLQMQG